MKTKQKLLAFNKIKIAKVNSYTIVGGTYTNTNVAECTPQESRTPKGGRTQSTSDNTDCDTSA